MINSMSGVSARQTYSADIGAGGGNGTSLLDWSDMTYEGAFTTDSYNVIADSNGARMYFGGGGVGFNASNGTLWTAGEIANLDIFEMSIPLSLGNAISDPVTYATPADLPKSTVVQARRISTSEIPNYTLAGQIRVGSILDYNGKTHVSLYEFYDGPGDATDSHFYLDSTTLSGASVAGLYRVGSLRNPGYVSGYMGTIPSSLQSKLGGYTHFCGNNGLSILGRTSQGPCFVAFNPDDIGVTEPTNAGWYLYYDLGSPLDEGRVWNQLSRAWGAFIPEGTNCVIYIGRNAVPDESDVFYGWYGDAIYTDPATLIEYNDTCITAKGYHATAYSAYYWAFDLDDLEAVKNGTLLPSAVAPYAHGPITYPLGRCEGFLDGIAHDAANRKIYTSERQARKIGNYTYVPVWHCWSY